MSDNQGPDIQKSGQVTKDPPKPNLLQGLLSGNMMKQKGADSIVGKFMEQQNKKTKGFEKEYTLVPADINVIIKDEQEEIQETNKLELSLKPENNSEGENNELLKVGEVEEKKSIVTKYNDFKEKAQGKIMTVLKFAKGAKFFTTDTAGFEQFDTDLGQSAKKNTGYFNHGKLFLQILIAIALLLMILYNYLSILGSEKSQSLKYTMHSNLSYPIEDVPKLLPAHQFVFIQKDQIENRMLCKEYNDENECKKIEILKCNAKGESTEAFEFCMIELNEKLQQNTTEFCVQHYTKQVMNEDSLDPSMSWHWERMHACYEKSGIARGRQYCDDMKKYQVPAWDQDNLFNCYRKNNVDFAKEYCEYLFADQDSEDEEAREKLLQCYGTQGVSKGKEYCDTLHPGESREDKSKRIDCYDNNDVVSKLVCDDKKSFYYWSDTKLQGCYRAAGYILNKDFCLSFFPLISQLDERYECFNKIGLNIVKDRTYCELKYPEDNNQKFDCIDTQLEIDPKPKFGGDYCYVKYKWFDQYEDLYECLQQQGFEKTSSFCNMEAQYKVFTQTNGLQGQALDSKLKEISDAKWVCQKPFFLPDPSSSRVQWDSSKNCTKQSNIIEEGYSSTPEKLILDDTSKMSPSPLFIQNTGDLTMIQQTYAVGGGIRLKYSEQNADQASYIIVGNYLSGSQDVEWDQYGKLIYIKDAQKDLLAQQAVAQSDRRRNLMESTKDSERVQRRVLSENDDHSLGVLTPDMNSDLGESLNFIDNRQYNSKVIEMIADGRISDYEVGQWHFSHANQLEVEFPSSEDKYSLTYDEQNNQLTVTSSTNTANSPWELSFGEQDDPQTQVVQNWGKSIQEKMNSFMKLDVVMPNMDCQFVGDGSQITEWKYDLDQEQQIQVIELFNFQNGVKSSLLQDAKIYIGDNLCAQLDSNPPSNTVLRIICQNPDEISQNVFSAGYKLAEKFLGTIGNSIRIVPSTAGVMTVCDAKAFVKANDVQPTEQAKTYCANWISQCDKLISSDEDKDNCLERFGQKKDASSCVNLDSVEVSIEEPKFYYPLKNKYECLTNYQGKFDRVELDQEVHECLSMYFMFAVEQCLNDYEKTYSYSISWIGERNVFSKYGATQQNIILQRETERQNNKLSTIMQQQSGVFSLQIPLVMEEIEFKFSDIEGYLCERKTSMFFSTNPFNDASISQNPQNDIKLSMKCEVFQWEDKTLEEQQQSQWVVHYYYDKDLLMENNVGDQFEEIKDQMFINGTELNEQYFQVEFNMDLQFMEIHKTELYMREQDPQAKEIDVPLMKGDGKMFDEFKANSSSVMVVDTPNQIIGVDRVDETTLDCMTRTREFNGIPAKFGQTFFGLFPLQFENVSDRIIRVFQELIKRDTEKMTPEEMDQPKFSTRVSLRVSFTEENFSFLYYSLMDLLAEVGGLGGAVAGTLSSFGAYIMMLFVVDLIMIIRRKYKQEKRMHNLAIIGKKLPLFKKIVMVRLKNVAIQIMKNQPSSFDEKDLSQEEIKQERYKEKVIEKLTETQRESEKYLIMIEKLMKQFQPKDETVFDEVQNEENLVDPNQVIDEDDLIDEQEANLLDLDQKYKAEYTEYYMKEQKDIFDELNVTKKLLNERVKFSFMHIVDLIKKRVSFFGIYSIWDQVELTEEKLMHLRTQLDKKSRLILEQQNQIRTNFNTLHKKVDPDKIIDIDHSQSKEVTKKERKQKKSSKKLLNNIN